MFLIFLTAAPISGFMSPEHTAFKLLGQASCPLCADLSPRTIFLNGYRRFDMRMRIVVDQREVVEREVVDRTDLWVDPHGGQRSGRARYLQSRLIEMIVVEVGVAKGVDELAWGQPGGLGDH